LHPHRHTGSCRTDETETSCDLNCLLHFEVGNRWRPFLDRSQNTSSCTFFPLCAYIS
jgi:hypothetical protein